MGSSSPRSPRWLFPAAAPATGAAGRRPSTGTSSTSRAAPTRRRSRPATRRRRAATRSTTSRLPTDANAQRELVVRRLAAKDSDIDIIGMDVIWTAEFAEAELDRAVDGARRVEATKGKLEGPVKTVRYKGKVWGIPFTTNTQLLWYRKDIVKTPPTTWDEMIDEAHKQGKSIEVQGNQYEGLTVWVNSLIAGAGGSDRRPERQCEGGRLHLARRRDHAEAGQGGRPSGHGDQQGGRGAPWVRVTALELRGQLQLHLPERGGHRGQGVPGQDRLGALSADGSRQAQPPADRRHQPGDRRLLEEQGPGVRRRHLPRLAREPARGLREGRPAPHHRVGLQRPQAQEGLPVRRPAA